MDLVGLAMVDTEDMVDTAWEDLGMEDMVEDTVDMDLVDLDLVMDTDTMDTERDPLKLQMTSLETKDLPSPSSEVMADLAVDTGSVVDMASAITALDLWASHLSTTATTTCQPLDTDGSLRSGYCPHATSRF